jgi:hypothetical protein
MNDIKTRFYLDLEKIVSELISAYGLKFKQEIHNLSNPLYRWLDFRLRYIDPIPRQIFFSNRFPKKLSRSAENALHSLETLIREGKDVNPFQSKSLIRFNDISGKKKSKRTDLLWANWGIVHLHLTDKPVVAENYFSERACSDGESWLLFCIFTGDTVGFIDIRKHDDDSLFSDQDMIRIIKDNWPDFMEPLKLNGILPPDNHITNSELDSLRKSGINWLTCIDGATYLGPGMGITSASTPLLVTRKADRILDWIDSLAIIAADENGQLQKEVRRLGVRKPKFELCLTPKGLAIFEAEANVAFTFPKKSSANNESSIYFSKMENLLFPDWALEALLAAHNSTKLKYRQE